MELSLIAMDNYLDSSRKIIGMKLIMGILLVDRK